MAVGDCCFVALVVSLLRCIVVAGEGVEPSLLLLPEREQEAAYRALESVNPSVPWRALYPDDLCLSGPHGIVCDLLPSSNSGDDESPHIVELNFGYVSEFSNNPPCGPDATLPGTLSSFPFLRKVFFYNCFTSTKVVLSTDFWNLSSAVEEIAFYQNPSLGGSLSNRLAGLSRLSRLIVSGSQISGTITSEVGDLRRMEQLILSRNRLRGEIPRSIGRLGLLKVFDVSGNRIGGAIPSEIGRLAELVKLDISSNSIVGRIPAELGGLSRVELLDLSENRLTGGVPAFLAELKNLREIHLSGNPLGGAIPEVWEKLGGVLGVGMSRLGLVGSVPSSMGVYLGSVTYLALDNNKLEGELSEQFRRMESTAMEINLENNGLRGRVPFSAGFVRRLDGKLRLAGNPDLCLGEENEAGSRRGAAASYLRRCNKTADPQPVLFTSSGFSPENGSLFYLGVLVVFLVFL
ncbi:piriformospora indica-insensitive protein 2-like [Zingiber officinale]|uniref:Disease resistance R13L4/SHOC-2-like LRR domain-containing protein n=1 Tax=Zingiber officinale TaxID=94328 RepID=A0A8J5L2I9_ZINOF|nr:piriformospora indica-insensitive protein 2-like [Zingiber officinale]KAG6498415.1 hypothetical protein ZIOFF_046328 [Zingiber officinale]